MNKDLALKYAPQILFDLNEPFYPELIGITIFKEDGVSNSFNRDIVLGDEVEMVIEYAIYWHFDIQHLFELEHVWIYIDIEGKVCDAEASFHGAFFKGLLRDKSNLDGTHVKLYSQPGKHAFMPQKDIFYLIPNLYEVNNELCGKDGLIVTDVGRGRYKTNDAINSLVKEYMARFKFTPTMEFKKYVLPNDIFVEWSELYDKIPQMIEKKLSEMKIELNKYE